MPSDVVLKVTDLRTYFHVGDELAKAVDRVSLEVRRGQIVGLVGESGSGKSVTGFSILGLVSEPGEIVGGQILLNGRDLLKMSGRDMRRVRGSEISMIFQDPMMTLNPVLRIETQMTEAIFAHRPSCPRQEAHDLARDMLGRMGIPSPEERLRAYPFQLSGGMCQRVAIATALLNHPDIIIADEPTTALDVTIQSQIVYEVQEMCRLMGTSLIWITHDLGVVSSLADELYVMYAGRIIENGPVNEVLTDPRHPYTQALIASIPALEPGSEPITPVAGSTPSLLSLPPGCTFHPRCGRSDGEVCRRLYPDPRNVGRAGERMVRCHYPLPEVQS